MTPFTFSKAYAEAYKFLGSVVSELACAWIDADYLSIASRKEQCQQELSARTLKRIEDDNNVQIGVLAGQLALKGGAHHPKAQCSLCTRSNENS